MLLEGLVKRCRNNTSKVMLLSFIGIVFAMEWFQLALSPLIWWPSFPSGLTNSVRILIVADPQLLGNRFSSAGILGYICKWDADRYVSRTFSYAYEYVKPDVVIFLGDNIDEGEVATDEEFDNYIKRFRTVFQAIDFHKAIIIPGDNDIGGEDEPPSPDLEKRFNKYFRDDVFIPFKFLEFIKVNYITRSDQYLLAPNISEAAIRIVLSHFPLTALYSSFISKVLPFLQPHLILSAHDHKSAIFYSNRQTDVMMHTALVPDTDSYSFSINGSHTHEIKVPTCSYRMGVDKMGYGALELSPSGETLYVVLWLPSRFPQLFVYLFCLVCLGFYILYFFSRACYRGIFSHGRFCRQYPTYTMI